MPAAKGSIPWNAGTSKGWVDKRGYRWIYVQENGRRRARREHRVLMEKHLGRRLEPWEIVHHKDENPSNNAIENLEVKNFGEHTSEHHTGTRKSYDSKRSMEAFALIREELKAVRIVNAELLKALQSEVANAEQSKFEDWLYRACPGGDFEAVARQWQESSDFKDFRESRRVALAAIAKATGQT